MKKLRRSTHVDGFFFFERNQHLYLSLSLPIVRSLFSRPMKRSWDEKGRLQFSRSYLLRDDTIRYDTITTQDETTGLGEWVELERYQHPLRWAQPTAAAERKGSMPPPRDVLIIQPHQISLSSRRIRNPQSGPLRHGVVSPSTCIIIVAFSDSRLLLLLCKLSHRIQLPSLSL